MDLTLPTAALYALPAFCPFYSDFIGTAVNFKFFICTMELDFGTLKFLSAGKSAIVYGIDDAKVLKRYYEDEDEDESILTERLAFDRLGAHANIVERLDSGPRSLVLERGRPLNKLTRTSIPMATRLSWVRDAAEGLQYVHQHGIIHADVGCDNMVLVGGRVKIIDFEGSKIDEREATSCYKWNSCQGIITIDEESDVFAFGCAVYEIITGLPPCHELEDMENRALLFEQRFAEGRYPEVAHLPLGQLVQGCWDGSLRSMDEVLQALDTDDSIAVT
ncbi:unnamed protein product [Clonostachys rhizophaga]|uniref:Protein kinase domain-containing protein n=1 Tax=Clonostachys rhizophaga TaxID=160324 RepID=A0A9N9VHD7_9HYPO|nr:unnamed protein product [Clonostachys rhizophaga]